MSLFRTKSIESLVDANHERRSQTRARPGQLIVLGVGAIIGTGIFVLTGQAAAANAGPAIVLSMVLAGADQRARRVSATPSSPSTVPVAGSAYTYAYATLGEFVAWIIGWDLILEYALGAATVAVGWSGYLVTLLAASRHRPFPPPSAPRPAPSCRPPAATAPRSSTCRPCSSRVVVTALLVVGVRSPRRVNAVIVVIKVAVVAAGHRAPARCSSTPAELARRSSRRTPGHFGEFGWSGRDARRRR